MAKGIRKWLGLGPNDINGYYAVTVSIAPLLPSNRIAEGQFGLEQANAGAIDMNTHREEFLHMSNPEEIDDKVIVQQELNDPQSPLRAMMRDRALKRAGLLDDLERMKREAELAMIQEGVGVQELMAEEQMMAAQQQMGAPGIDGSLTPGQPGLGAPLQPPQPPMPGIPAGMAGVPGQGGPSGMPGGRAAGMGGQPSTQGLPGGLPGG